MFGRCQKCTSGSLNWKPKCSGNWRSAFGMSGEGHLGKIYDHNYFGLPEHGKTVHDVTRDLIGPRVIESSVFRCCENGCNALLWWKQQHMKLFGKHRHSPLGLCGMRNHSTNGVLESVIFGTFRRGPLHFGTDRYSDWSVCKRHGCVSSIVDESGLFGILRSVTIIWLGQWRGLVTGRWRRCNKNVRCDSASLSTVAAVGIQLKKRRA